MVFFLVIMSALGWIAGIWLPWWAILGVLGVIATAGFKGKFDGGLEAIPLVIGTGSFSFFMVTVGFTSGNATVTDISSFIRVLFTGS